MIGLASKCGVAACAALLAAAACMKASESDAQPARAFDGATYHRVQGVKPGDTLNVREEPNASAPVVGTLAPDHPPVLWTGVSFTQGKSRWWRIATAGVEGWVNAAFLAPSPTPPNSRTHLVCFGNEPFWSLTVRADGTAACEEACGAPPGLRATLQRRAAGRWSIATATAAGAPFLAGDVVRESCSDGMSDFRYPWSVELRRGATAYLGCCRVTPAGSP